MEQTAGGVDRYDLLALRVDTASAGQFGNRLGARGLNHARTLETALNEQAKECTRMICSTFRSVFVHEQEPTASPMLPVTFIRRPEEQAQAEPLIVEEQVDRRLRRKHLIRRQDVVSRQGLALLLKTCGLGFVGLGVVCATFAVEFFCICLWYGLTPHHDSASDLPALIIVVRIGALVGTLALVGYLLCKLGTSATKRAAVLHDVLLNSANTADLPANGSLVRASQEPAQAQEGVLLRAASGEAQAGQEEQLLRAAAGE